MVAGPLSAVGQSNTYVKDMEATGRLQVEFSRNPNDFRLPNYVQIRQVSKDSGYYLRIDARNCSRIVGGNIDEFVWPDGADRPVLNNNGDQFQFEDYMTTRRNFGQQLGDKARTQAQWDLEGGQERTQAQKAMTARTKIVHTALALNANWDASHRLDVGVTLGGLWSAALSSNPIIKKSLNRAVKQIMLDTGSVVRKKDLILVINPTTAFAISETQELIDHIKQSPEAFEQVRGGTGKWSEWGLPDQLYGLPLIVEDAVINTASRGAAVQSASFVMGDAIAYILSRPGGLVSKGGGPSFSTATLFAYEEMTVEKITDKNNRRLQMSVVDDVGVGMTAPVAGMYLQNIL